MFFLHYNLVLAFVNEIEIDRSQSIFERHSQSNLRGYLMVSFKSLIDRISLLWWQVKVLNDDRLDRFVLRFSLARSLFFQRIIFFNHIETKVAIALFDHFENDVQCHLP